MELSGADLLRLRRHLDLSQAEMAERIGASLTAYNRWENEKASPQPYHRRRLREEFSEELTLLGIIPRVREPDTVQSVFAQDQKTDSPVCQESEKSIEEPGEQNAAAQTSVVPVAPSSPVISDKSITPLTMLTIPEAIVIILSPEPEIDEARTFIQSNMITALWDIAFREHLACNERSSTIRQVIKEFDTMNATNKNYRMTRREAMRTLATLPAITLGLTLPGSMVQPARYGDAIDHCASALEGCWELHRNGSGNDGSLAFQCVSKYLPVLKTIVKDSSQYRSEALDLAVKYALLKTPLALSYIGSAGAMPLAEEALTLSKGTGDISLTLSAYNRLIQVCFFNKKYTTGLVKAKEAECLLRIYEKNKSNPPLHPSIQGGIYSKLALMQAKNSQSPDWALGKATDIDIGDESHHALIDFSRSALSIEIGLTYCYQGDQKKATEWLEKRVDPKTLTPKIPQSGRGHVQTINVMTLSSLKERDKEKTIHFWKAGIEGARALKNEQRFNEALANFDAMELIWPDEPDIAELRPLTERWEVTEYLDGRS